MYVKLLIHKLLQMLHVKMKLIIDEKNYLMIDYLLLILLSEILFYNFIG